MQTDTLAQEKPSRENLWLAMLGIRLACVARTFSLYMTSSLLIPAISEGLDYQSHPSFLKVKVKYIEILENRNRVRKYLTQAARVRVSRMGSWIGQSGI